MPKKQIQLKLEKGEKEVYEIVASAHYSYRGDLILTTKRLIFFGVNIFTGKSISVSVPYKNILSVKKVIPSNLFTKIFLAGSLKITYSEKGKIRRIRFGQDMFNFLYTLGIKHLKVLYSVFSFIEKRAKDEKFYSRVAKSTKKIDILEPRLKKEIDKSDIKYWTYTIIFFVLGFLILMFTGEKWRIILFVFLLLAYLIRWVLEKSNK